MGLEKRPQGKEDFSGADVLVLGAGNKHSIAQPWDWADMDQRLAQEGENKTTRPPKGSDPFRHTKKNELHIATACTESEKVTSRVRKAYLQTYLHKATVCTSQAAASMLKPALLIFLSPSLFHSTLYSKSTTVFTREDKELTYQFPCQVYNLPIKLSFCSLWHLRFLFNHGHIQILGASLQGGMPQPCNVFLKCVCHQNGILEKNIFDSHKNTKQDCNMFTTYPKTSFTLY